MKPKYIRVVSDLHCEQRLGQREEFLVQTFIPPDPRDAESILVLAGDISSKPPQLIKFLGFLKDRFIKVLYLPGNHEAYHHDIDVWEKDIQASIKMLEIDHVICSGNEVKMVEYEGLRVIFGTLWADGGNTLREHSDVSRWLNDFHVIKKDGRRFTVPDMQALYKVHKAEIIRLLKEPFEGKTVVATHHMPSLRLCHPRFGIEINGGFASNCEDVLAYDHAPTLWIHGHTHDSIDTMLWKTRIVCNPSGYISESGSMYNQYGNKFIEIDNLGKDRLPADHQDEVSDI